MAGLFDSLNLGSRSLNAHRQGVDVAGHNLANVNTPGYARQRAVIESVSSPVPGLGSVGAGADAVAIESIRSHILDSEILQETSVSGGLEMREELLKQVLSEFNTGINRSGSSSGVNSNDTFSGGINDALNNFFNSAQALSGNPASITDRELFLESAKKLANALNQTASGLEKVSNSIDNRLESFASQFNASVSRIGQLNAQIVRAELRNPGSASELKDTRQVELEQLARLAPVQSIAKPDGSITLALNGQILLEGNNAAELQLTKDTQGVPSFKVAGSEQVLQITSGEIGAAFEVRNDDIPTASRELDELANAIVSEINQLHAGGYSLQGATGQNLFVGNSARSIALNKNILDNPQFLQLSGDPQNGGDNMVILKIATLGNATFNTLGGKTFSQHHIGTAGSIGQNLATTSRQVEDQNKLQTMLTSQRDSIMGVSVDEEVSTMVKFQKAFEASARFIQVADEMLDAVLNLKR